MMNMYKLITVSSAVVMLAACAIKPPADKETRQSELALASELFAQTVKDRDKTKNAEDPGMIRIERHTAGYTISMVMDATDDNVYFVMDLPEEEQKKQEEAADTQDKPAEDKAVAGKDEKGKDKAKDDAQNNETEAGKHVVYAQTYFFEKKYGRALSEANRAIEYAPNSAIAHSLKGSIHFKRGEKDQAKVAWEKAVELDPGMEDVKAMLEKVKN